MIPASLSLEQAPPLSTPLRFFLTAPLYLVAAGALLAYAGPEALETRWDAVTLALTHLLALGFAAQVMFGAALQVLPVVAGAPVARPRAIAMVAHLGLNLGTPMLATGLLGGQPWLLRLATLPLGIGVGTLVVAATLALARARSARSATVTGLRLAFGGLAVTLALGVLLALARSGIGQLPLLPLLAAHVAWGFLGWILALVAAVAYQVVPMFQVTPPYPARAARLLLPTLFAALAMRALAAWAGLPAPVVAVLDGLLAALAFGFAVLTLWLQHRRRRRIADVTVQFWRFGLACLAAAALLEAAATAYAPLGEEPRVALAVGMLALPGFAVAVISGMLYRIVPFLVWFHAQARAGIGGAVPRSAQVAISPAAARGHRLLYLAGCALLGGALFLPATLALPAGVLLAGSGAWLARNLLGVLRRAR